MIKGKNGFWLLLILFSLITMMVVMNGENYGVEIMTEMDGTMGSLMQKQHPTNLNISSIIKGAVGSASHHLQTVTGHHQVDFFLRSIDFSGTALILLLLPLMVGGSVLMIILWI